MSDAWWELPQQAPAQQVPGSGRSVAQRAQQVPAQRASPAPPKPPTQPPAKPAQPPAKPTQPTQPKPPAQSRELTLDAAVCRALELVVELRREGDALAESNPFTAYCSFFAADAVLGLVQHQFAAATPPPGCASEVCDLLDANRCRVADLRADLRRRYAPVRARVDALIADIAEAQSRALGRGGSGGGAPADDQAIDPEAAALAVVVAFAPGSRDCRESWFSRVVGLADAKRALRNSLIAPLTWPNMYGRFAGGVLLYGPPGTGKSLLARAAVNELRLQSDCARVVFFAPTAASLKGKYVGETEKRIEALFRGASRVACASGGGGGSGSAATLAVVFIDEFDSIAPAGRGGTGAAAQVAASSVNALLQAMDGVGSVRNVAVVAATNLPWTIDPAVLRRFPVQVYVPLPTREERARMLHAFLSRHVRGARSVREIMADFDCALDARAGDAPPTAGACAPPAPDDGEHLAWTEGGVWVDAGDDADELAFADLMPITAADVEAIAARLHNFSGSDIESLARDVVVQAAEAAEHNGLFFGVRYRTAAGDVATGYVSSLCFGGRRPTAHGWRWLRGGVIARVRADGADYVHYTALPDLGLAIDDARVSNVYVHEAAETRGGARSVRLLVEVEVNVVGAPGAEADEDARALAPRGADPWMSETTVRLQQLFDALPARATAATADALYGLRSTWSARAAVWTHAGRTARHRVWFRTRALALGDEERGAGALLGRLLRRGAPPRFRGEVPVAVRLDDIEPLVDGAYTCAAPFAGVRSLDRAEARAWLADFARRFRASHAEDDGALPALAATQFPTRGPLLAPLTRAKGASSGGGAGTRGPLRTAAVEPGACDDATRAFAWVDTSAALAAGCDLAANAQLLAWNISPDMFVRAERRVRAQVGDRELKWLERYSKGEREQVLIEARDALA